MIASIHIENFKCFKDLQVDLGPFTVLVGPNDSGKTAFLQAIRLATAHAHPFGGTKRLEAKLTLLDAENTFWQKDARNAINFEIDLRALSSDESVAYLRIQSVGTQDFEVMKREEVGPSGKFVSLPAALDRKSVTELAEAVGEAVYYRFDPSALREPSDLCENMDENGLGLPGLLLTIAGNSPASMQRLSEEFSRRYPSYLQVKAKPAGGKKAAIFFQTAFGDLPASLVSDGAILSLAFLALAYLPVPPGILLIEEPENGVHHAKLKEIVDTLRDIGLEKHIQVVLTTHSPYLLDLVSPEDVRVFSKDAEGAAHAIKLSDVPDVEEWKKHFMTGEIWTSMSEQDLLAKAQGGK